MMIKMLPESRALLEQQKILVVRIEDAIGFKPMPPRCWPNNLVEHIYMRSNFAAVVESWIINA